MYGQSQPMNIPAQIAGSIADVDDDVSASPSVDNHHSVSYDAHTLDDGVGVDDVATDPIYVSAAVASASDMTAVHRVDGASQLTLSFRGQVYVFDAITPDKFHAVLLLLGGAELTSVPQGLEMSSQNQRIVDFPSRSNQPHRAASLDRFRRKRKERCFDKKVRYGVRQEVALRMQRNKGQFTSAKKSDGSYSWGPQDGQEDNLPDTSCTHCGISSKSTPMMRRGPSGPRSLCNACGLFWANKGTLRDIPPKKTQDRSSSPVKQGESEANDSDCGTGIPTESNIIPALPTESNIAPFSNGDDSALMANQ